MSKFNKTMISNNFNLFHFTSQNCILYLNKYIKSIFHYQDNSSTQFLFKNQDNILTILKFFNKSSFFRLNLFTDMIITDCLLKKRFIVDYFFSSCFYNSSFRLTFKTKESQALVSISALFSASVWSEREAFDMFGLFFINNKDLRRLLTDYGFSGHPLKKDFPMSGYYELSYKDSSKQIAVSVIETSQNLNYKYLYSY